MITTTNETQSQFFISVVIPCYKVTKHIKAVIEEIPASVDKIYAVDDCCPENSGAYIQANCKDPRVHVLKHEKNAGVGGAMITGYKQAMNDNMDIVIKIDGDGQMDPALIPAFIEPIISGDADYTKGNRFYNLEEIHQMPKIRLLGNAVLSLLNKLSSGYWDIFDPTNGYTAIHVDALRRIPFDKLSNRYFFESDMLFRLNIIRAKVVDVAMDAKYGDEESNLKIKTIIGDFLGKHVRNIIKRIFYNYFLRDMSVASIELALGTLLLLFGSIFGAYHWAHSVRYDVYTSTGTVMLAVLPVIVGIQFLLSFLAFDIESVPKRRLHRGKKISY